MSRVIRYELAACIILVPTSGAIPFRLCGQSELLMWSPLVRAGEEGKASGGAGAEAEGEGGEGGEPEAEGGTVVQHTHAGERWFYVMPTIRR